MYKIVWMLCVRACVCCVWWTKKKLCSWFALLGLAFHVRLFQCCGPSLYLLEDKPPSTLNILFRWTTWDIIFLLISHIKFLVAEHWYHNTILHIWDFPFLVRLCYRYWLMECLSPEGCLLYVSYTLIRRMVYINCHFYVASPQFIVIPIVHPTHDTASLVFFACSVINYKFCLQ